MSTLKTVAATLLLGAFLSAPAIAQESAPAEAAPVAEAAAPHGAMRMEKQPWSFGGIFGTYDKQQLQRGFQVFQAVCAQCHGARLMSFRNLQEPGGPEFSEEQVKALAASYQILDATIAEGTRPGVSADRWPNAFATELEGRDIFGVYPPDLSVMAKARGISDPFPFWIFNYFTAYAEGGPDYIHALLLGYVDPPPAGAEVPDGKSYNTVFPGNAIAMPPPLSDGVVTYEDENFPQTAEQYSRDVSAFLMWVAEPHLVARKESGFRVILFLVLFAGLMYFVKQRLWSGIHRRNPGPDEVLATGTPAAPPSTQPGGRGVKN